MIKTIIKRDGAEEKFQPEKITWAIFKVASACGGDDFAKAESICRQVMDLVELTYKDSTPTVEDVQDAVEKVLIENGHAKRGGGRTKAIPHIAPGEALAIKELKQKAGG